VKKPIATMAVARVRKAADWMADYAELARSRENAPMLNMWTGRLLRCPPEAA
jgi:hypothetical protein